MLYIPTKLCATDKPAVISLVDIKKGNTVWEFNNATTQVFWKKHFLATLKSLPTSAIKEFLEYSYLKDGNIYLRNDNSRYFSDSHDPNLVFKNSKVITSIKDIKAGEELLLSYSLSYDRNNTILKKILDLYETKKDLLYALNKEFLLHRKPQPNFLV